jgi:hypothetical protein
LHSQLASWPVGAGYEEIDPAANLGSHSLREGLRCFFVISAWQISAVERSTVTDFLQDPIAGNINKTNTCATQRLNE